MQEQKIPDPDCHQPERCKKWAERQVRLANLKQVSFTTTVSRLGSVYAAVQLLDFKNVAQRADFDINTPHLVPGWCCDKEDAETGGMCLVFTTFNMVLNIYQAQQWYGEVGITTSIDHAFKVSDNLLTTHTCTDVCTYTCVFIHTYLCMYIQFNQHDTPYFRTCLYTYSLGRVAATSRDKGTACPTWRT